MYKRFVKSDVLTKGLILALLFLAIPGQVINYGAWAGQVIN